MKKLLVVLAVVLLGADDAKQDQDKLQGDWVLELAERDGERLPEEIAKTYKRNIKTDKFIVTGDRQTLAQGSFKLEPSKKPKTMDIKLDGADSPVQGIYEITGDTFKICYAAPGQERPKEFSTKAGSGHTLGVWKRAKK